MATEDQPTLTVVFEHDAASGLYWGQLENGARFAISPANVSGKLGANLDLLRQFTARARGGEAPHPHVATLRPLSADEILINEALDAENVTRLKAGIAYGVNPEADKRRAKAEREAKRRASASLTLEDIGL